MAAPPPLGIIKGAGEVVKGGGGGLLLKGGRGGCC